MPQINFKLNVPYVRQDNEFLCAKAALQMVASFLSKTLIFNADSTYNGIHDTDESGFHVTEEFMKILESNDFTIIILGSKEHDHEILDPEKLRYLLETRGPLAAVVDWRQLSVSYQTGHFITIIGVTINGSEARVIYHCPTLGKNMKIDFWQLFANTSSLVLNSIPGDPTNKIIRKYLFY